MVCNASSWLISEGMRTQYFVIFIRYECKEGAVVKLAVDCPGNIYYRCLLIYPLTLHCIMWNINEVKNCI